MITDMRMHYDGIGPNKPNENTKKLVMCYMFYFTGGSLKLSQFADACDVDSFIWFGTTFFCE
jgi:hypothetical protein